jgi:hypothetical protein
MTAVTAAGPDRSPVPPSARRNVPGAVAVGVVAVLVVLVGSLGFALSVRSFDVGGVVVAQTFVGAVSGAALWAGVVVAVLVAAPGARSIATVALIGTVAQFAVPLLVDLSSPGDDAPGQIDLGGLLPGVLLAVVVAAAIIVLWYPWRASAPSGAPAEAAHRF